jgi:hypothetical protein
MALQDLEKPHLNYQKEAYGDAFHFKSLRHTGRLPFALWYSTHSQQKPCLSQSLLLHVHFSLLISILGHCARFFESLDGNIFTTFLYTFGKRILSRIARILNLQPLTF